jgi:hypothetical protein
MISTLSQSEFHKAIALLALNTISEAKRKWLHYLIDCFDAKKPVDIADRRTLHQLHYQLIEDKQLTESNRT